MRSIFWIVFPLLATVTTGCARIAWRERAAVVEAPAIEAAASPSVEPNANPHVGAHFELARVSRSGSRWRLSRAHPLVVGRARADVEEADRWRAGVVRRRGRSGVHDRATPPQRGRGRLRRDDGPGAVDQRVARAIQPVDGGRRRSPSHAGLGGRPRVTRSAPGASCVVSTRPVGKLVWRTNILQDTGAKNLRWGMAGSPLIAGDAVIVLPGGPRAVDRSQPTIAGPASGCGRRSTTSTAYVSPMQVTLLGVPAIPGGQRRTAGRAESRSARGALGISVENGSRCQCRPADCDRRRPRLLFVGLRHGRGRPRADEGRRLGSPSARSGATSA